MRATLVQRALGAPELPPRPHTRVGRPWRRRHPDKHTESAEATAKAEAHFKLLGEALEILADDFTRRLYNEGYDKEAIAERVAAANRAAHNHEKDGCCNRGGGCGGCG